MPQSTLALQVYTLRDFLKTPRDIAATLKKVSTIGYRAVELAGLGSIAARELAAILSGEGLTCCATHTPLEKLRSEPQKVIDEHAAWGCRHTAVPIFRGGATEFAALAGELNSLAASFAAAGLHIGYHNHSHELVRHNRRTLLDLLIEQTSPSVWFEIDTYWITHGGGDPAQWIAKVSGRIPCVHLKDMSIDPAGQQRMAEVGQGNLNWPAILAACDKAAVQWRVVEQDACQGDPFDCIATSLRNLRELGVE